MLLETEGMCWCGKFHPHEGAQILGSGTSLPASRAYCLIYFIPFRHSMPDMRCSYRKQRYMLCMDLAMAATGYLDNALALHSHAAEMLRFEHRHFFHNATVFREHRGFSNS